VDRHGNIYVAEPTSGRILGVRIPGPTPPVLELLLLQ
jgi:hypothetical protein